MMNNLEKVFGGYPELYSRLLEILGSSNNADVSVVNFYIDSSAVDVQVFLKFNEDDLPVNFRKKSKNFLRFKLTLADFTLSLSQKTDEIKIGEITSLSQTDITFALDSYQYAFSCNKTVFYSFEASNFYELVDRNFGVSLDDLVGKK